MINHKILNLQDVVGIIRPIIDAHTLGISSIKNLLEDCGYKVIVAGQDVSIAINELTKLNNVSLFIRWLHQNRITRIGFSYRLDPKEAQNSFGKFIYQLEANLLFEYQGGMIKDVYFAGLPEACFKINREYSGRFPVFGGNETAVESLRKLGVPDLNIPKRILNSSEYDNERNAFASKLILNRDYNRRKAFDRTGYSNFGTKADRVVSRIHYAKMKNELPLIRAHVGPYNKNYSEALREFNDWLNRLSRDKWLDIVSIGSSQLSQSDFGCNWGNRPNGGGVPLNTETDLINIYEAARPMLVRTYAGTRNISNLAKIYEKTINMAWHALSFWWFCKVDGRGPYSVKYNLQQHLETLKIIATNDKPFEPNIPHHFSFRGADDFTYVLSGVIAAKTAKKYGIRHLILQNMLNTPKGTWGIQDLAKGRALLRLVKELENDKFNVYYQPRAGLDYFSPDLERSKIQLSSVTAMMDDIDPLNEFSPEIIHVVSFSEALYLANPDIINESIKITFESLHQYRNRKRKGDIPVLDYEDEIKPRYDEIIYTVKKMMRLIENNYSDPYSPTGLYKVFRDGLLPVPYLWEGREEFQDAVDCKTKLINGSIKIVDDSDNIIDPVNRLKEKILSHKQASVKSF